MGSHGIRRNFAKETGRPLIRRTSIVTLGQVFGPEDRRPCWFSPLRAWKSMIRSCLDRGDPYDLDGSSNSICQAWASHPTWTAGWVVCTASTATALSESLPGQG